MKVFLTGGTGFIGGNIAKQLRERGDEVVCLVRSPEKARGLTEIGCQTAAGDLSDVATLSAAMQGCDAIIHAAAMYEIGVPSSVHPAMHKANVEGTENVMRAALEARAPKVVYVSTCAIFGNTHGKIVDESYEHPAKEFGSYYEQTKWEAHKIVKRMMEEDGLPAVILQPGGVYGPGDSSATAGMIDQFLSGKLPLVPFPDCGLCFSHVEDIAAGVLLGLDKGKAGQTYVISGPATTIREALEVIAKVSDRKPPKRAMPTVVLKALTPIGPLVGKLMGQPPNLREMIASADGVTFWGSYEKAAKELGYAPRGLEQGLRETLEAEGKIPAAATA